MLLPLKLHICFKTATLILNTRTRVRHDSGSEFPLSLNILAAEDNFSSPPFLYLAFEAILKKACFQLQFKFNLKSIQLELKVNSTEIQNPSFFTLFTPKNKTHFPYSCTLVLSPLPSSTPFIPFPSPKKSIAPLCFASFLAIFALFFLKHFDATFHFHPYFHSPQKYFSNLIFTPYPTKILYLIGIFTLYFRQKNAR